MRFWSLKYVHISLLDLKVTDIITIITLFICSHGNLVSWIAFPKQSWKGSGCGGAGVLGLEYLVEAVVMPHANILTLPSFYMLESAPRHLGPLLGVTCVSDFKLALSWMLSANSLYLSWNLACLEANGSWLYCLELILVFLQLSPLLPSGPAELTVFKSLLCTQYIQHLLFVKKCMES